MAALMPLVPRPSPVPSPAYGFASTAFPSLVGAGTMPPPPETFPAFIHRLNGSAAPSPSMAVTASSHPSLLTRAPLPRLQDALTAQHRHQLVLHLAREQCRTASSGLGTPPGMTVLQALDKNRPPLPANGTEPQPGLTPPPLMMGTAASSPQPLISTPFPPTPVNTAKGTRGLSPQPPPVPQVRATTPSPTLGPAPELKPGRSLPTPAQQIYYSPADCFRLQSVLDYIRSSAGPPATPSTSSPGLDADTGKGVSTSAGPVQFAPRATKPGTAGSVQQMTAARFQKALGHPTGLHLPSCYQFEPPAPIQAGIGRFSDETLFFLFYSNPRNKLQELAARHLYEHGWRYHKQYCLWLSKDPKSRPTLRTDKFERGRYTFFDPGLWTRAVTKTITLQYDSLEERFPPATPGRGAGPIVPSKALYPQSLSSVHHPTSRLDSGNLRPN